MAGNDLTAAMANRSLRTIKTELEFLTDASLITPAQLSTILSQLPNPSQLHAPMQLPQPTTIDYNLPIRNNDFPANPEKRQDGGFYSPAPTPVPVYAPPPSQPQQPALHHATALFAYVPSDAGDLALAPHDRVAVTEYMNAEWWKGRSERTGQEGIFPRSYVKPDDLRQSSPLPPPSYGNMPMAVAQGNSGGGPVLVQTDGARIPSKGEEMGKKFGKKLGNAAVFGAGATIGSNIVNSIF